MFAVAFLISLMPPGLCACWISPSVADVHFHFGQPPDSHSHDYLSDSADAVVSYAIVQITPQILSLMLYTLAGVIWTVQARAFITTRFWSQPPLVPPPRPG